jgi:hypothetical protein
MLSFGQLFGSNFWSSFKAQPSESIEKLLAKDDCQLEELLDDSDLLQECKNNNKNLVKYLNREKIKELIDLITVMPETDEHNRGHKYPFLANEVFNCDIQEIGDKFFISPADDVEPEEPDEEASDEGEKDKFGSHFEKDNADSGSDSEEEGAPEGEKKSSEDKDDFKAEDLDKEEDKPAEGESQETEKKEESTENKEGEAKQEAVELDVEDKVEEKKLDTPEDTPVPADADKPAEETTDNAQKEPETSAEKKEDEKSPEDTKSGEASEDSQNTETTPTDTAETVEKDTDKKEEEKQSEETPEADKKPAEGDDTENQETNENTEESQDDASTHVSEAASEATQQTEAPKEPLSTNKYELFDYLNRFIDTDIQLNDVLSGYYARLCNILIQKKSDEVVKYFYTNPELLYRFAYHSYSKSLTDTVIKILDVNTFKDDLSEEEVKKVRREFISRLLERLADDKSEVSYEYSLNIFQIFNELTYKKAFYELLIEQEVLDKLKDILIKPESPESNSNAAVRMLNVLISHLRDYLSNNSQPGGSQGTFMEENDEVVLEDDEAKDSEFHSIEEQVAKHHLVTFLKEQIVDHLVEQLDKAPETAILDFQYADKQYVLGKKRLACVNLMESLVELDDVKMRAKIMETKFYEQLFDLFLEFRFNTFLQLHLDTIFHRILKDQITTNEQKVAFLEKLQIFTKLPAFWKDNQQFAYPSSREFRHGYLAFTTRFANTLRDVSKTVPEIEPFLEKPEWKEFVEQDVNVYNEKNAIVLANRGGDRKDSDEFEEMDDDKFKDLDERDDLDDDEDKDEDEYDDYNSNRNSMRKTLQEYDASKAREQHENLFVGENIEKDEEENDLFSGLNSKPYGGDDSSDDDKPIGGSYDDDSDDDDSENEKEDVSENSDYYDNSYWQVDQYNIEDLLQG